MSGRPFENHCAIVTGAASGIGLAVARQLVDAGASVVALDRDGLMLQRAFPSGSEKVVAVEADIARAADRDRAVEAAATLGEADLLVNAAGVIQMAAILEVTEELWDRINRVNAAGTFFMCQRFARHLLDRRRPGAIVNLSSVSGKAASTVANAPYNASKAAVIAITKTFAHALAEHGIRVNCVAPGSIDTPMQQRALEGLAAVTGSDIDDLQRTRLTTVPLGRVGTADEVAAVVLFLLGPDSSYMTGQTVNVTGGQVMY